MQTIVLDMYNYSTVMQQLYNHVVSSRRSVTIQLPVFSDSQMLEETSDFRKSADDFEGAKKSRTTKEKRSSLQKNKTLYNKFVSLPNPRANA